MKLLALLKKLLYPDITGIIIIALDLTAKELSQITGEPHTQIKERLIVMAVQQFNQMTTEQVTEWIKTNYPIPSFILENLKRKETK